MSSWSGIFLIWSSPGLESSWSGLLVVSSPPSLEFSWSGVLLVWSPPCLESSWSGVLLVWSPPGRESFWSGVLLVGSPPGLEFSWSQSSWSGLLLVCSLFTLESSWSWPEKSPLRVLLWLVLHVVAHPIDDGLQRPRQGLHEVYQVPHPLKSCLKFNFSEKLVIIYILQGLVIFHLFTKFDQNCSSGLVFVWISPPPCKEIGRCYFLCKKAYKKVLF